MRAAVLRLARGSGAWAARPASTAARARPAPPAARARRCSTAAAASAAAAAAAEGIQPPTRAQLGTLALAAGIPFIGFGFADNFIMIIAGEQIDCSLGVRFGLSTLAAAGIGNLISDVVGLSLGEVIEVAVAKRIRAPRLSPEQLDLRVTRFVKGGASLLGITVRARQRWAAGGRWPRWAAV